MNPLIPPVLVRTTRGKVRRAYLSPVIVLAYLLGISLLVVLGGCAVRLPEVADLARYPQHAAAYVQAGTAERLLVPAEEQARLDAGYNERFFAPWRQQRASLSAEEAFWGVTSYGNRQGYAENLLPIGSARWQQLVSSLQRESYPSLARPAITVRNTVCRVFPTARPFFLDPSRAGEGFPFDYFQNSALWAGTPLLVTHVSVDGAWFFAETGFVAGWLPAQDLAWADEPFRSAYQTGQYAALLRDEVTLRSAAGEFLTLTHLGAIFPVVAQDATSLQLLVPVRDADGAAVVRTAALAQELATRKPLPLQPGRIAELADHMLGQAYGWGGLFENRDCSATLRDLFTPFGIWLPRNSAEQAKSGGTFHDLANLDNAAKRDYLLQYGVPFYTLVWLKGHVGLYLGTDPASGEPLLLHNLWGVRTTDSRGREGRALVGRLAITTLHPGEERPDVEDGRFFRGILGMTILPGAEVR
ncbi:MAG: SH3 domain-containing protein [Desulfuromonadales bacterium]|nr:SH3 domain-containing protein [Desulfuromonadales bacterium]